MPKTNDVEAILKDAESRLAQAIDAALRAGQYEEISRIAQAARTVARAASDYAQSTSTVSDPELLRSSIEPGRRDPIESDLAAPVPAPTPEAKPQGKAPRDKYPRFERDESRLFKLGWSAKDKAVYEHRVALDVAKEVASQMRERVKGKKPFKMEKLVPFHLASGAEVPGYQAYLVLKWLQELGEVRRQGNEGYLFSNPTLTAEHIANLVQKTALRN